MRGSPFNLLDTPGHQDFSPLGFQRGHLPHPDRGRQRGRWCSTPPQMAPRGHRGADPQALRGVPAARRADHHLCQQARPRGPRPVRPVGRDRAVSGARRDPASWPIGMGRDFLGSYDLFADALLLFERGVHDRVTEPIRCSGLDDPKLPRLWPKAALAKLRDEDEMAKGLCPPAAGRPPADLAKPRLALSQRRVRGWPYAIFSDDRKVSSVVAYARAKSTYQL